MKWINKKGKANNIIQKPTQVIYDSKGWKFYEVGPELKKEIHHRAKAMRSGKVKSTSLGNVIKRLEKIKS